MTNVSAIDSGLFRTLDNVKQDSTEGSKELGQQDFLTLMLEQIKNQDPFKPMENGDFLAQMAQFSTVNGITEMQESLENLSMGFQSSQVLEASSLVGKQVLIPTTGFNYQQGDSITTAVDLPAFAQNVKLEFFDKNGALIKQVDLGEQQPGEITFSFDGLDSSGEPIATQDVEIRASFFNGQSQESLVTMVQERVDSVRLAGGGAQLAVDNVGDVPLGSVLAIKE